MPETAAQPTAAWDGRRIVIVHDWLTGMRGGEAVLEAMCRVLPTAEIATLVHVPGSVSRLIESRPIRTSVIQRLPWPGRLYRHYLPMFPTAIELLDVDDADVIVSISTCAAKSIVPTGRAVHICYCNTPMRYGWDQFDEYFGPRRVGRVASAVLRGTLAWLARWDRATASRVDHFVANSRYVAGRIAQYYNRASSVIYPPVDTAFFTPGSGPPEPFFLVVSALVPYKRLDRAILAAAQLGVRLRIVGTGPDETRLRGLAGPTVEFAGALDRHALREAYRQAQAVVLPGVEDFGIVPLESMACGRPAVALGRGGARETVDDGVTGLLVADDAPDTLAEAMHAVSQQEFDAARLHAHAARFSTQRFEAELGQTLTDTIERVAPC